MVSTAMEKCVVYGEFVFAPSCRLTLSGIQTTRREIESILHTEREPIRWSSVVMWAAVSHTGRLQLVHV